VRELARVFRPLRDIPVEALEVLETDRGFADSPLEEEGFEPSVPEKARLKGSGRLKVLPGLRYAGGASERATFGFPCGAENPVICLDRHAPLLS
jgi:hypothetical protein